MLSLRLAETWCETNEKCLKTHLRRELVDAELLDLVEDLAEGLAQLGRHQVLPAEAEAGGRGQAREILRKHDILLDGSENLSRV